MYKIYMNDELWREYKFPLIADIEFCMMKDYFVDKGGKPINEEETRVEWEDLVIELRKDDETK